MLGIKTPKPNFMAMEDFGTVTVRADGSFVINGGLYHVSNGEKHKKLHEKVKAFVEANPDKRVDEAPYTGPTEADLLASLRGIRDSKLAETDYLLTADYPITEDKLAEVKAYRTALRDITGLEGCPWDGGGDETPWPVKPEL